MSRKDRSTLLRNRLLALRMVGAVAILAPSASLRAKSARTVKSSAPVSDSLSDTLTEPATLRDTARHVLALSMAAPHVIGTDTEEAANASPSLSRLVDDTAPQSTRELDSLLTRAERERLAVECPRQIVNPADRPAPEVARDVLRHGVFISPDAETLIDPQADAEARAAGLADYLRDYPAGDDKGSDASLCSMMGTEE